jgi:hypothetical protein
MPRARLPFLLPLLLTVFLPAGASAAPSYAFHWDGKKPQSFTLGDTRISLSVRNPGGREEQVVLDADRPGMPHLHYADTGGSWDLSATVELVDRLDAHANGPAIVVTTFSGGAHASADREIFAAVGKAWKHSLVEQDGDPDHLIPLADRNGDGIADIVTEDDDFIIPFGPTAEAAAPVKILDLSAGKLVDVTRRAAFAPLLRGDLTILHAGCLTHVNGMCAPFVAEATLLGFHDWAWGVMLANYDAKRDPGFPATLTQFLAQHHYAGGPSRALTPTFACLPRDVAVRQRICASPSLSELDENLAAAYLTVHRILATRAEKGALPRDAVQTLADDEAQWIKSRDDSGEDETDLGVLYRLRIAHLMAMAHGL